LAQATQVHDGGGCWLTPGLIDCHTHIVHAGNRSDEFEARLNGASYEDIARAGGGIMSTVRATRAASEEQLLQASLPRIRSLLAEGVTTLEIKSGYGLTAESEAAMLRVARRVARELPVEVSTTFLGAHAVPPEYAGRGDAYVDAVCAMMAPLAEEGLIDAVDAFCERIGFTAAQTERVFAAAQQLGGNRLHLLRRDIAGEAVHQVAPGPEAIPSRPGFFRAPSQRPLETVRVQIDHARQGILDYW
jgi:imidazolonepropionase